MREELVRFQPTGTVDLDDAQSFAVTGPETAEIAVELREGIKALIVEIEAAYQPHIATAHKLHKALLAELATRTEHPRVALQSLNTALGRYELDRQQAETRARVEAEAEALRAAEEQRAADAQRAREAGDTKLAASIESAPVEDWVAPPAPVRTPPKTKGVAVTQSYEVELTNLALLVEFAWKHPQMMVLCLAPNYEGLNALCKQTGEKFNIPGVKRVMKTTSVRSTRGRS